MRKKTSMIVTAALLVLWGNIFAGEYTMAPDGSFVGGNRAIMTPDGDFIGVGD